MVIHYEECNYFTATADSITLIELQRIDSTHFIQLRTAFKDYFTSIFDVSNLVI